MGNLIAIWDIRRGRSLKQYLDNSGIVSKIGPAICRTVIIPRRRNYSLDMIMEKFSAFGDIERLSFEDENTLRIDYYDVRAVRRLREFLQHIPPPFSEDRLSGILRGVY